MMIKQIDGQFHVAEDNGRIVLGPFSTNAAAWKAADRMEGEPVNPAEKRTDWSVENNLKEP